MQNIPQKGRGLGHVTPKIFGIQSSISYSTWARDFKFGTKLVLGESKRVQE